MPKKVIDLGFCPRCFGKFTESDIDEGNQEPGQMGTTRVVFGVRFCRFCSFDIEDNKIERRRVLSYAKQRAEMEGLI